MRRLLVAAAAALALLSAAPPAGARETAGRYAVEGSVVVGWEGAPGRCEAAGVCGVRGTLTVGVFERGVYRADERGTALGTSGRGGDSVARVERGGDGGPTCVDVAGSGVGADIAQIEGDGDWFLLKLGSEAGGALSAGRCAGPRADDLRPLLPAIRLRGVVREKSTRELAGRRPFAAGAFDGEVVSALRVTLRPPPAERFARGRPSPASASPPRRRAPRRERHRVAVGSARYRVAAATGALGAGFAAGPDGCELLDACGTTGRTGLALGAGGDVVLYAEAPAGGARPAGFGDVATAPRARVGAFGDFGEGAGTLTAEVARPGGPPCRDRIELPGPTVSGVNRGGRLVLVTTPPRGAYERTRCPGPFVTEAEGVARIPLDALGQPRIVVELRSPEERFADGPFSGRHDGAVTLELERVASQARIVTRTRFR